MEEKRTRTSTGTSRVFSMLTCSVPLLLVRSTLPPRTTILPRSRATSACTSPAYVPAAASLPRQALDSARATACRSRSFVRATASRIAGSCRSLRIASVSCAISSRSAAMPDRYDGASSPERSVRRSPCGTGLATGPLAWPAQRSVLPAADPSDTGHSHGTRPRSRSAAVAAADETSVRRSGAITRVPERLGPSAEMIAVSARNRCSASRGPTWAALGPVTRADR